MNDPQSICQGLRGAMRDPNLLSLRDQPATGATLDGAISTAPARARKKREASA